MTTSTGDLCPSKFAGLAESEFPCTKDIVQRLPNECCLPHSATLKQNRLFQATPDPNQRVVPPSSQTTRYCRPEPAAAATEC